MKAALYARYSSEKQDADSIEAQRRACIAYADQHGLFIVGEYIDEAISGKGSKTSSRPQYQKMLRDCERGVFRAILVHKYDRVARSLAEHINLEKKLHNKGIELVAVAQNFGTTNEAKIMRALTWAISEYYLDNLSDETKKGHKETAMRGLHNGGYAPFGYDTVNQTFVINELEAEYVKRMFMAAANRRGFVEIVRELDERGIKGKRGRAIKYPSIYEILRNEKYTGTYIYYPHGGKRGEGRQESEAIRIHNAFPAIIDKDLFTEVQRIMNERKQTGKKAGYLCSGLVFCECGAKMHGMRTTRKGHEYFNFYCSKKCGAAGVKMSDVDCAAVAYLKDLLSAENQRKIAAALHQYHTGESNRIEDFNKAIKRRIADKQNEYDTLMNNLKAGTLPPKIVEGIGQQMQELLNEIDALRVTPPPRDFTTEQITAWLESLKSAADAKAVQLLVERIDVRNKTVFNITSTLNTVLGKIDCGSRI